MKPSPLLLLTLLLLCNLALAQRGGGSRSSSSSSRSRSRSFYRTSSSNSTGGWIDQSIDEYWYLWLGGFGSLFGVVAYVGLKEQRRKRKIRDELKQGLWTEFQGRCEANPCTLDEAAMAKVKDWFMSQKWTIRFSTSSGSFNDTTQLTLKDITPRNRYSYNLKFTMTDSIGSSHCDGVLVHQGDYFGIMFDKTYDDKQKAGQTGNYDVLLYEGVQQGEGFVGKWWYKGFEGSGEYSGGWAIYH